MRVLYRCDQCAYEEWRDDDEPVTLCVVCGYMMWEPVRSEPEGEPHSSESDSPSAHPSTPDP